MILEKLGRSIEVMETILFTDIYKQRIDRSRVSDLAIIIQYIGIDYGLNPCKNKDFEIIKKIIINSVKNN